MYGCPWYPFSHSARPLGGGSADRQDTRGWWCLCGSAAARIRRNREWVNSALQSAECARAARPSSYCNRRFDCIVAAIAKNFEILERIIEQTRRLTPNLEPRQGKGCARQLQIGLRQVIQVQMTIAAGPYEIADLEIALLREHMRQQRVGSDVEGNAQQRIGTALIELAG